ncbi:hypothetical protein MSP8886_04328 [Marinomonas spartinae]|uniref:Outer membrane protein beta-barrel domain-containing protein n=1 Tax=Marinomonas spartinae TaxID=1792290 RepID=A0A1A8TWK8_9GAMM|nr:hypothetical protein MSP8886_04328 [Marinomonas spartinae]
MYRLINFTRSSVRLLLRVSLLALFSVQVYAKEVYQDAQGSFFIELSGGSQAYQSEIAFGLEPSNMPGSFGGLYLGASSLTHSGSVRELGVKAFNFSELTSKSYGATMHISLSRTRLGSYRRRGFEVGATVYGVIYGSFTWLAGSTVRPRELSWDWHDGAITEMRSQVGLNYRLSLGGAVFVLYQYDNFIDSSWRLDKINGTTMLGINWLL